MRFNIISEHTFLILFSRIFNQGVLININGSLSIKEFLSQQLKIDEEYIEKRIQTIFLDSKPVDDLNSAMIKDGSILALSAAMPGAAGALFRKQGRYAPMREQISFPKYERVLLQKNGKITLKIFNLLAEELAQVIFAQGVFIDKDIFEPFIISYRSRLIPYIKTIYIDDKQINREKFFNAKFSSKEIFISITDVT